MGLPLGMKRRKAARWAPKAVITRDYCPPSDGEHGSFGSDYLSNGPTSSATEAGHEGLDLRDELRFVVGPELRPRAQRAGVHDAVDEEPHLQVVGFVLERPSRQASRHDVDRCAVAAQ